MTKRIIDKTLSFTFFISLYLLMISFCAYAIPVIGTSDVILEKTNLSSCNNIEDITSLENYTQTFVVITPKGCLVSETALTLEKVIPKLPLPKTKLVIQGGSSEADENLRISSMEEAPQESKNKRSGILKLSTWWLFVTIAFVNMASPGGAVLISITTSLTCGFSRTFFTTLGHACAMALASATIVFGLGFISDSSNYILIVFKFTAALYFIYLGIDQWKSKVNIFETLTTSTTLKVKNISLFINGFLIGILNPHTLIFFTAFTPKVLDTNKSLTVQFIVIAVTYIFVSVSVLTGYAAAAISVKRWFSQPKRILWFRRVSGAIFVTLGLGVLRLKAGLL